MQDKLKIAGKAFVYPMPLVIVGTMVEGKPNWMAAAWVSQVNYEPPMIGVAISKRHHTRKGIRAHQEFGLSIPGADLVVATDHVGMVSGNTADKSHVFESFAGELRFAPMAKACPFTMECRVIQVVDLPSNDFVIGEIIGTYSEERFLTGGMPDVRKMRPFTLTMPDNMYWGIGEPVAKAWSIGKTFKQE